MFSACDAAATQQVSVASTSGKSHLSNQAGVSISDGQQLVKQLQLVSNGPAGRLIDVENIPCHQQHQAWLGFTHAAPATSHQLQALIEDRLCSICPRHSNNLIAGHHT
jgi:hypothetical protein